MQNSCNTIYPRNVVCLRYITVNTLHKGETRIIMIIIIIRPVQMFTFPHTVHTVYCKQKNY